MMMQVIPLSADHIQADTSGILGMAAVMQRGKDMPNSDEKHQMCFH
jgi:hypothetical protein